jgi:zinc/manganese transport system substrate-binding protein
MRLKRLALLCLLACSAEAKLKIVATVSDLGAIAREVAQESADIQVLANAGLNPHTVSFTPQMVLTLRNADLLLMNGLELEAGWAPLLTRDSRNPKIQRGSPGYLDLSTVITPKEVPVGKLDRSLGDIHPGGNPHYTKDPRNAIPLANAIAQRLSELDAPNAAKYAQNAKAFEGRVQEKVAQWEKALAPHRGTPVVTFHKSWVYFTEWAGLEQVGFVEPKPGVPPDPDHVRRVVQMIKERKVPLLLQETWYSMSTSSLIASSTGAILVRVPGMAGPGKSYLDSMTEVVEQTLKALDAKAKPAADR